MTATRDDAPSWTRFDCDGHEFEYLVVDTTVRHDRGQPSEPCVVVTVRCCGEATGPAIVYPGGTVATVDHAREVARRFWDMLVGTGG